MTAKNGRPALTYLDAGVDLDARAKFVERLGPIAKATHGPQVLSGIGPFGGMYKLGGYQEPVLVSSTDSVGTKVKIASLLGRFGSIGFDLVNQSVDDIITTGADPLFFLDYIASSSLDLDEKTALVQGVATACGEAGCALIGGETADMPDVYAHGDLDFVGFVVGAVERGAIIDGSTIEAGDALLVPHRSYVAEGQTAREQLKGITHITGGGLLENVPRMLPEGLGAQIDSSAWERPALFSLLQREGNIAEEEMYRTFNMGIGLVVAVASSDVDAVLAKLPNAFVAGQVISVGGDERVEIS